MKNTQPTLPEQGQTIDSACGLYYIKYDPHWDSSQPYSVFVQGDALTCWASLSDAQAWCRYELPRNRGHHPRTPRAKKPWSAWS